MTVPSAAIAQMRAEAALLLPDSCAIRRVTSTQGAGGGYTTSETTVATVACRLAPAGVQSQERVLAERLAALGAWVITLPHGTDARTKDRLVISGRTFEVNGVVSGHSYGSAVRVAADEVT